MFPEETLCVHELFEVHAAQTPGKLCVVDQARSVAFGQVLQEATLLARQLQSAGVGAGMAGVVGLLAPPSADWIVAKLAILMAGGAVLPMYTNYTADLVADLCESASVAFLLVDSSQVAKRPKRFGKGQALVLNLSGWMSGVPADEALALPPLERRGTRPSDPAIMAMTSGSTGVPKAIVVSHAATVLSFAARWMLHPFDEHDNCTASNIFFAWEALRATLSGLPTYVVPDDVLIDPKKLIQFLLRTKATRIMITSQLLQNLLDYPGLDLVEGLQHIRRLYLCGEVVLRSTAEKWAARTPQTAQLINHYSSWESLDISYGLLPMADSSLTVSRFAPAGAVAPNAVVYVVGPNGNPVPRGVQGDVLIGGRCTSEGYLADAAKTAQKFIPNYLMEFAPSSLVGCEPKFNEAGEEQQPAKHPPILYKSGDLGRILDNGELEVCGRGDSTVKIRGYKVGLPSVERALTQLDGVLAAVVAPLVDPESRQPTALVAYVIGVHGVPGEDQFVKWTAAMQQSLPSYAVPSHFLGMEAFPTRPGSGKLDRKSLPPVDPAVATPASRRPQGGAPTAPGDTLQAAVADGWRATLKGTKEISIVDNFFEVGGHSLLAGQLVGLLTSTFGLKLEVLDVYEHPTIAALSEFIRSKMGDRPRSPVAEKRADASKRSTASWCAW